MSQQPAMQDIFQLQKQASVAMSPPTAAERLDRIDRVIHLLTSRADAFEAAIRADFGHRSPVQTLLSDILGILMPIKHTRRHVRTWMQPQRTGNAFKALFSGSARIEWVPRGVVGIIAPWNFPVGLTLQPLVAAFAAGNRAMIKVSEFTPRTSALLQESIGAEFAPEEAAVITGGPEVGAEFTRLPFDLVFFTGATGIARHVQKAVAENLVPTVLELGGKSPVVIGPRADLAKAAARIAVGKTLNAGQICLSPDHVYLPRGRERHFVDAMRSALSGMYPTLLANDNFTSIINERHFQRLQACLADARSKGAELVEINPAGEDFTQQPHHKLPPTLILNARADMLVMQEEIFGPLLPVIGYDDIDEVIRDVNSRPRPLATYYFGPEDDLCRRYLDRTISGGVTINDVLLHVANEDLPFGGVGDSGMGYYHGRYGFEAFSHPRAIVSAPLLSPNRLIAPPYNPRFQPFLQWQLKRERRAAARRLNRSD
jgi:coniferyl-aldehyde dehydrogenase